MSKKGILIGLFLSLSSWVTAQNCTLLLTVFDGDANEPLSGAIVAIDKIQVVTDEKGVINLDNLPCKGTITVSFIGFQQKSFDLATLVGKSDAAVRLYAENQLLQSTTVTASRFEKPLSELTVSLDILKPTLIDNANTKKLDDILQKVPGVQVVDGQANIRGGSGYSYGAGSRVLMLMDDIPILTGDAGAVNWRDLPIENLEQVEIVKGAASALYGSSAMNGIINLRTAFAKSEPETKFATFVTGFGNPADGTKKWWNKDTMPYEFGVMLSQKIKFGKLDVAGSAFYFNQDSYNKGTTEKYGRFNLATRYQLKDNLAFALNFNFNKGESNNFFYWNGDGSYKGAPTTYNGNLKTRYSVDPSVTYFDKKGNRHKLLGRLFHVSNNADGGRNNFSDLFYGEYQFSRVFEAQKLSVTGGLVATQTKSESQLYGNTSYTATNRAAYVQLDKKFFERLNINLGVRYEANALFSPEIIRINAFKTDTVLNGVTREAKPVFRIGANYQAGKATFLRASYGQGYRYPTIAEKFIQTTVGFQILPNPKIVSETGWTAELGIKQGFILGGVSGFVDVAGFWSQYDNMLEFNLDRTLFAFRSFNVGNTRIRGIETSVMGQGKLGGGDFAVLAGYTYIEPIFRDYDSTQNAINSTANYNVLKYRFRHNFKADAEWRYGQFYVGSAVNYLSRVEAIDKLFEVFIPGLKTWRANESKGTSVVDIRVGYHLSKSIKLSFLVNNLLNETYTLRPGLLEAPATILFASMQSFKRLKLGS